MTKEEAKKMGATHYLNFYDETWFLRWSFLLCEYVTIHDDLWVTFSVPKHIEIKPL